MHFANRTEDFGRAQPQLISCFFGLFSLFLALLAFDFSETRTFYINTHSRYKIREKNKKSFMTLTRGLRDAPATVKLAEFCSACLL